MSEIPIRRALIAVYEKTGVAEFARALVDEFGVEIISTGGTARHLKDSGVPVTMVEDVTGFPELLGGRVKTLHPKIFAAILADRDNPEHMRQLAEHGIKPIDLVVVNLYPFEKTIADPNCRFEDAIEMIDIGGPCLLRAAAKNHKHVIPVPYANAYGFVRDVLKKGDLSWLRQTTHALAQCVFWDTCSYDECIREFFRRPGRRIMEEAPRLPSKYLELPWTLVVDLTHCCPTRYGENPHQMGGLYTTEHEAKTSFLALGGFLTEQPKVSFNNYVDSHAALWLCAELTREAGRTKLCFVQTDPLDKPEVCSPRCEPDIRTSCVCVFIKHTNACGVGVAGAEGEDSRALDAARVEAYRRAYLGDPNAAMGGILAANFPVDAAFAEVVMGTLQRFRQVAADTGCKPVPQAFFIEVWLAPAFDDNAVEVIRMRKPWGERVRLLDVGDTTAPPDPDELDYRKIAGGMLVQTPDTVGLNEEAWKVVTQRAPDEREMADLRLAWLIAKHTKSNAVSICRDGMLIGNGAGQMSRVMSCRIATWAARENGHTDKLAGAVAASDAFFPFRDGPDILIDAGVTAIIQPGGSKRDAETIAACDERNVAMVFTGTRHFRH